MPTGTTRRSFLRGVVPVLLGAANWIGCRVRPPLNRARRRTLEAVVERLIPSDDGRPGAREARVIDYIDRALADRFNASLRAPVREFCDLVEKIAADDWGRAFTELEPLEQDQVLAAAQGTTHTFEDVLELALEGFLGHPRHGGNFGGVGWEFIGFRTKSCD